jgi:putative transposase
LQLQIQNNTQLNAPASGSCCNLRFVLSKLKRFHGTRDLHFITFSCYRRLPLLGTALARTVFEQALEDVRRWYGMFITGYVVMPEHVHLLVGEPERSTLSIALQMLKQNVARTLCVPEDQPRFWQRRYYDFNVWTEEKRIEKLRYIHRNPVTRGLVVKPEDWTWSSFRHWPTGEESVVEIESQWTARKRERMGLHLSVKLDAASKRTLP